MSDLLALAERCEAASGPDRELDKAIWLIAPDQLFEFHSARSYYTSSLDAAMTLVPEHDIDFQSRQRRSYAAVSFTPVNGFEQRGEGWAATPALALTAAALRARARAASTPALQRSKGGE